MQQSVMDRKRTMGIVSDIHYASAAEQARGRDFEFREITNPGLRLVARVYRNFSWQRDPLNQNHVLDQFVEQAPAFECGVATGDFSCNSAFIGVSDPAACQSARECLGKLRLRFGERLRAVFGDHELGKKSMFAGRGGMRLASLRRAREELGLSTFWQEEIGSYVLIGVTSSLIALPVFEADVVESEKTAWERERAEHLEEIRRAFGALQRSQHVLLFCHDPTALPFLSQEPAVRDRLAQVELTVIGHLHTDLVLWKSRLLAGMPPIGFLGHTTRRLSKALSQAREWRPFHVRLCPALAGIELVKRPGYVTLELDLDAREPVRFRFHRLAEEGRSANSGGNSRLWF